MVLILYKILGIMKHMKPAKENVKKCKKTFRKTKFSHLRATGCAELHKYLLCIALKTVTARLHLIKANQHTIESCEKLSMLL